jgi:HSP20 family protein
LFSAQLFLHFSVLYFFKTLLTGILHAIFSARETNFHDLSGWYLICPLHEKRRKIMNTLMKKANGNGSAPASSFSGMVDKVFQENLSRFFNDDFWGFGSLNREVNVPVNVRQTDKSYELELVAPGLKKEDFKINISRDILTVSFEHSEENKQQSQGESWLRKEYNMRSFSRSFNIDDTVDVNKIEAKYSDGILHLSLPIKETAKPMSRTIEIK